jgi:ParB family chromosome partitioning protein
MPKHSGLGKGLDALIPIGEKFPAPAGGVMQIPVEQIGRNPRQPRVHFDEKQLAELADSIREHGVIQPLVVSPVEGGAFILITGERRLRCTAPASRLSRHLPECQQPGIARARLTNAARRPNVLEDRAYRR